MKKEKEKEKEKFGLKVPKVGKTASLQKILNGSFFALHFKRHKICTFLPSGTIFKNGQKSPRYSFVKK